MTSPPNEPGGARRFALVVGASGGIGEALARQYAARGYDLGLISRDAERLRRLAGGFPQGTVTFAADLADPRSAAAICRWVSEAGHEVQALVNAAGYFSPVVFAETPWRDDATFLQVMLATPCELVRRFLPGMLSRGSGQILNVASLIGLLPGVSSHSLYCASKSFLIKFSQSVHLETRGAGVHVTALCPGLTDTDFFRRNGTRKRYQAATPGWLWQTPEQVAKAALAAVEANRAVCVPGLANKTIAGLSKLLPDGLALSLAAQVAPRFR